MVHMATTRATLALRRIHHARTGQGVLGGLTLHTAPGSGLGCLGTQSSQQSLFKNSTRNFAAKRKNKNKTSKPKQEGKKANKQGQKQKEEQAVQRPLYELYPTLYTSNPLDKVSLQDVGKYVETPDLKLLPEGLAGETELEFEVTDGNSIQLREQTVHLLKQLDNFKSSTKKSLEPFMLVEGVRGCGKSSLLNAAVLYARQNDWIVMYATNPRDWISEKHGFALGTETAAAVVRSQITPEKFGQPNLAVSLLKNIEAAHGDKLKNLQQKREYKHQLYQRKNGDNIQKSLYTIVERGLKFPVHASNCVYDLRMELGLVTDYPVLIVCDQFNSLFWPTCFWYQGKQVTTEDLLTTAAFKCLDEDGKLKDEYKIKNGTILCATTKKYDSPYQGQAAKEYLPFFRNNTLYEPFNYDQDLKPEGRKSLKSSRGISIHLKNLDNKEFDKTLKHYERSLNNEKAPLDQNAAAFLKALTESNPKKIREKLSTPTAE